ncbi:MAG: PEP-CTERM sorting domain-containing protein [Thiobacillus sp.]|nr:PEP-CTERM sorting domain-containing protein [Thiobacillus sp.]
MNKQLNILCAALVAGFLSAGANADMLVDWDLSGMTGTEASRASFSAAAGITGLDLARGAGLAGNTGANSLNTKGWDGANGDDYISFGFSVAQGLEVDLDSLVIGSKSSSTGPGTIGLFHNGDNFTTALTTFVQDGANYVNAIVDLSNLASLTGTVEFRLYEVGDTQADGVGATSSAGTFRVAEYTDGANFTNLQINGAVAAPVPEPETYALMLAGLGLVGALARRRKG